MFDWFLFYLRRHLWRLLLCCDFPVCFFFPLLHFLDIPLMHATTTCIPNKLLSLHILGLPIQKLSWTFQKLESVLSAARGKYWHKWIWTLQSFLYSGFIVPWKQMKSIEKSENMTGRGKKQNERTMPLARKWELTKMMIYVAFYFHVQWFITIMKLCQLIDFHKQTTVLQEGWLFI